MRKKRGTCGVSSLRRTRACDRNSGSGQQQRSDKRTAESAGHVTSSAKTCWRIVEPYSVSIAPQLGLVHEIVPTRGNDFNCTSPRSLACEVAMRNKAAPAG